MKKVAPAPDLLPASTAPPGLRDFFTNGVPASIDGDPVHDRMLSELLNSFDAELSIRFGKRSDLYREWLALPNVTLTQGAWLLLGRHPFEPSAPDPQPAPEDVEKRHLQVINRLECEVIAGRLKPVGQAIAGFDRRFSLISIANTAARIHIATSMAAHLIMISEHVEQVERLEPSGQAWQTERVLERIAIHTKLIDRIRSQNPERVAPLARKKQRSRVRRAAVVSIDVQIDMPQLHYEMAFRELFQQERGGIPDYHITRLMLEQDREQLNVKFKSGRRSKASKRPTEPR